MAISHKNLAHSESEYVRTYNNIRGVDFSIVRADGDGRLPYMENMYRDYDAGGDTPHMVSYAASRLTDNGYHPYYLYRQSRCVGNQENVGWAKPGYEGLYNVYIMDETHTILACGAGGVSKLKKPNSDYLERIFNYKFPYEYNTGLAELLRRKEQVIAFYEQYGVQANTEH